jgi:hypothetical protein
MAIEKDEMDIDNFIREKLALIKAHGFNVEPSANFCEQTIEKICEIDRHRRFLITYGIATFVAIAPTGVKYLWLVIRNDYFSAKQIPFGDYVIPFYQFIISVAGSFILLAVGIAASIFFIKKQQHQEEVDTKTRLA